MQTKLLFPSPPFIGERGRGVCEGAVPQVMHPQKEAPAAAANFLVFRARRGHPLTWDPPSPPSKGERRRDWAIRDSPALRPHEFQHALIGVALDRFVEDRFGVIIARAMERITSPSATKETRPR